MHTCIQSCRAAISIAAGNHQARIPTLQQDEPSSTVKIQPTLNLIIDEMLLLIRIPSIRQLCIPARQIAKKMAACVAQKQKRQVRAWVRVLGFAVLVRIRDEDLFEVRNIDFELLSLLPSRCWHFHVCWLGCVVIDPLVLMLI